jgi:hypothetical protein
LCGSASVSLNLWWILWSLTQSNTEFCKDSLHSIAPNGRQLSVLLYWTLPDIIMQKAIMWVGEVCGISSEYNMKFSHKWRYSLWSAVMTLCSLVLETVAVSL